MNKADFKPAWWLPSPHLQTLWPVFFKKRQPLELIAEQVELDDGDFIDLRWSKKHADKTVLVLHGLEGSLESHYVNGIMFRLEQSGYKPVLMHFRGCGGRINRLARAYHSGETGPPGTVCARSGCTPAGPQSIASSTSVTYAPSCFKIYSVAT